MENKKVLVKALIVGIDPGTTVGVAILNLEGEILDLSSFRSFSLDDIVEYILDFGIPMIMATDVSDVHHTVEKLSAAFGCKTFAPQRSLSVKEKNEMTKEYTFGNAHERDALASVLKARDYYRAKFENVDARLENIGAGNLSSAVKTLVLKDYTVKDAVETLTREEEPTQQPAPKREHREKSKSPKEKIIERLKRYNRDLLEKIERLEEENKRLKRKNEKIFDREDREVRRSKILREKERVIHALTREIEKEKEKISDLQRIINDLKGIRALELSDEAHTVKILDYFTKNSIKNLDKKFKIKKGDIIYIRDPSGGGGSTAEILVRKQVRALIIENRERMSHNARRVFENEQIPVLSVAIRIAENFGAVDTREFQRAFGEWEMERAVKEAEETEQWLDDLLKEYKKKRIKK